MSSPRAPRPPREAPAVWQFLDERGLLGAVGDVCKDHGVTLADVIGRGRHKRIATARGRIWSLILNSDPDSSYSELARLWDRDHTTVMSSVRRHEARLLRAMSNRGAA